MLFMPMPARSCRFLICTALVLLAGCEKAAQPPAGKAAGAQVLPGTISDSMLDVDRSQSQPLLAPPPRTRDDAGVTATDDASDAAVDAPAKPDAAVPAN
jgi:hypothetical protein